MDDQSKYYDSDQIDAYLLDRLSEAQKKEFEAALKSDPELRKKVGELEVLRDGVEALGRENLKKRFTSIENQFPTKIKPGDKSFSRWSTRIAAVILLLLVPGYFIVQSYMEIEPKEVFATHFQPYPVIENGTVRGGDSDRALTDGLRAYQRGEYKMAIQELSTTVGEPEGTPKRKFYLALSYLASGDASQAIPFLEELAETNDFTYREQARWYLGLALLKSNRLDEARSVFRSLYKTTPDKAVKLKAKRVLRDL